jgi:hypothetical protein
MSGRCPSPATVNGRSTATGRPAAAPYTDEDEVTTAIPPLLLRAKLG